MDPKFQSCRSEFSNYIWTLVHKENKTMDIAKTTAGAQVTASNNAPKEAICPYCGGVVTLRSRKLMGNQGRSYYWRHRDNENRNCPGRSRRG